MHIKSYYGGVFEIETDNENFIVKVIRDPDTYKIAHIDAEITFCRFVHEHITSFTSQTFITDKEGGILQQTADECFYLLKKHSIVKKDTLSNEDQQTIGRLMRDFHRGLHNFEHKGIGESTWMREVNQKEYELLLKHFKEEEFVAFVQPLNYEELNLPKTLLHGDWHGENFSFSNPPFLFDLDTLCYGSPAEEIARTITHWYSGSSIKNFYKNIIKGYETLSDTEIIIIPRLAVAICYKQFAEVAIYGDLSYANHFKELADEVKSAFSI